MFFRRTASGKNVFLSVDSRDVAHNPLYNAFKACSFTDGDITFHFYLLDLLADGTAYTSAEIATEIERRYLAHFETAKLPDESTVRKKLGEYVRLGLVKAERNGRKTVYRGVGQSVDLDGWQEAVAFFSEQNPLGVIGSYILDKYGEIPDLFRHKHHYMLHATDSEIICTLATAITQKRRVSLKTSRRGSEKQGVYSVFPYKIYISTQWGRQYLLCYCPDAARPMFFRTDGIVSVAVNEPESESEKYGSFCLEFSRYLWGVSVGTEPTLESVEAVIRADENEEYIVRRLIREKRCGQVESMGGGLYRFTAQVYDAAEMLPWLRTFTGRVVKLECSNPRVTQIFWDDLRELERMYGGGQNAAE